VLKLKKTKKVEDEEEIAKVDEDEVDAMKTEAVKMVKEEEEEEEGLDDLVGLDHVLPSSKRKREEDDQGPRKAMKVEEAPKKRFSLEKAFRDLSIELGLEKLIIDSASEKSGEDAQIEAPGSEPLEETEEAYKDDIEVGLGLKPSSKKKMQPSADKVVTIDGFSYVFTERELECVL
jgi:hypothetical protein